MKRYLVYALLVVAVWVALVGFAMQADLSQRLFGREVRVTQAYLNVHPANPTRDKLHAGIDFGAPRGEPVKAARGGTVVGRGGIYGKLAVFDGANTVIYLHMTEITGNKNINPGDVIGKVGSAGVTAAHLHVEVRKGRQANGVGMSSGIVRDITLNPVDYLR